MNFRLTMVLVIVLLVTVGLWMKFHGGPAVEGGAVDDAGLKNALLTPQPKEVKALTFTQDGQKQVAFAHEGTEWALTYPVAAPANTWDVSSIADSLKGMTYKEKFEPETSGLHTPENTGIDKPHNVVTFTDDGGKEHTLNFGKTTVGGMYATLDGGRTIYLLATSAGEKSVVDKLSEDPQTFRNKTIKETAAEKIVGLTIKHGNETVSLVKRERKWMIDAPIAARGNATAIEDMVNEVKSIRASAFSDFGKDMPATGLKKPVTSVTATVEEKAAPATTAPAASQPASAKTTFTIDLGYFTDLVNKKNVYASLAGSNDVFTLSADTFNKLSKELKDLRDPSITPAALTEATHVSIARADGTGTELAKTNGEWAVTKAKGQTLPADAGAVSGMLTDLRNLRAIKFVDNAGDLKSIGLEPAQTKVEITVPGQSQHEVLLIGKAESADAVTPMMRQGEPTVYLVQTVEVEKLGMTPLALRDRTVDRVTANDVQEIEISGAQATGGGIVLERDGPNWKVTSQGKSEKADDTKVTALLADFSPLTATKYVGEGETVSGKADIEVKVTANEGVTPPTTKPSTMPATAPVAMGPKLTKPVVKTLRLYRVAGAWRGLWDGQAGPAWTFEPGAGVVEHLMTTAYGAAPAGK